MESELKTLHRLLEPLSLYLYSQIRFSIDEPLTDMQQSQSIASSCTFSHTSVLHSCALRYSVTCIAPSITSHICSIHKFEKALAIKQHLPAIQHNAAHASSDRNALDEMRSGPRCVSLQEMQDLHKQVQH